MTINPQEQMDDMFHKLMISFDEIFGKTIDRPELEPEDLGDRQIVKEYENSSS